jgi:hypothetical protein
MNFPSNPDRPRFDLHEFETRAIERAQEFVDQIGRLAVIDIPDEYDWVMEKGGSYSTADGSHVEVKQELYDNDDSRIVAKARITEAPLSIVGNDGQRRIVTLSRNYYYHSFWSTEEAYLNSITQDDDTEANRRMEELATAAFKEIQINKLEDMLDPNYKPSELIWARSVTQVECKLPKSPNYRIERYSPAMSADTQLAHLAARRRAGEQTSQVDYSIPEHKALMARLQTIDPNSLEAEPLDQDFDVSWTDPQAPSRVWVPKK